jgi:hypothetical protein
MTQAQNRGHATKALILGFLGLGIIMVIFDIMLLKGKEIITNGIIDNDIVVDKVVTSNIDSNSNNAIIDNSINVSSNYDPKRLCEQNQYAKSLTLPLSEYGDLMDTWLDNAIDIEKKLTIKTLEFEHNHDRFDAFEVMGSCDSTCLGGECLEDQSKITCGVKEGEMEAPCVVYSIGGNNEWAFELDVLKKTPCEVHTFDCTGPITRFSKPENDRLHFHHVCLGRKNLPAPKDPIGSGRNAVHGEFWTLEKMQKTLKHSQIDLFKVDIEGFEWPMFNLWPDLTDMSAPTSVLPMQILVEVHYQTQMTDLARSSRYDFKYTNDMINLQSHFLKMGYAVVKRDDNKACKHCTELTLVRIRCPETLGVIDEVE